MSVSSSNKLSTRSAIFISLSSMIGAGIFIKTQTLNQLSHHNITPVIFLFLIFLVNIFAFSFVLVKIIPSQTSNAGFMDWSREYCPGFLHKSFVNFMRYFYHPLSLVIFSIYGIMGITGNRNIHAFILIPVAFCVTLGFMFLNLISFKWSHKIQMILWILVLIPLILLPFFGMLYPSSSTTVEKNTLPQATGIDSLGPWMIIISGLPSVLFIYDGFYNLASLKEKLTSSKKLSFCLIVSFILVTIIYLYVIIGFNVGDKSADYKKFSFFKNKPVLKEIFEILVGCAGFLTLNSIALSNIPQLVAMDDTYKFRDVAYLKKVLFYKRWDKDHEFEDRFITWIYLIFKTFIWFVVIGVISFLANLFGVKNGAEDIVNALADIVSVFVFAILATIILGSLYKSRKLKTSLLFKTCCIVSGSLIVISLIYLLTSYVVGITGYSNANIFGSFVKLLLLFIFICGAFFHKTYSFIDRRINRKKYILFPPDSSESIIVFK